MLLAEKECAAWSDNQIAKHCGVHHDLVGSVRTAYLAESARCDKPTYLAESTDTSAKRTVTRNGVTYRMNVGRIGKRQAPAPEQSVQRKFPFEEPKTNEHSLLACPFCGATNADLVQFPQGWMAKCNNPECAILGPRGSDELDAQDAWNARKGPGKYEATAPAYRG